MTFRLLLAVSLLSNAGAAQTTSTKGESLDKVQVVALLAGDVPNSRVASLVVERGITFDPTDRFIQLLQKAGGDEGVVTAVRVAHRPTGAALGERGSGGNGPLERDQILDLLQTGVESSILAKLVASRGIDFEPYDEYLHVYELAGAKESVLDALRQAGQKRRGPATAAVTAPKAATTRPGVGTAPARLIRVPAEKMATRLIYQPSPVYPEIASMARIQGVVRLRALIGPDGRIEDLKALSGHPFLIKSTMDAVSTWRYQPTLVNGKPVEVETEIAVNYTLRPAGQ